MPQLSPWDFDGCPRQEVLDDILRGNAHSLRHKTGDEILEVLAHSQRCSDCRRRRIAWTKRMLSDREIGHTWEGFRPVLGIPYTAITYDSVEPAVKRAERLFVRRYGTASQRRMLAEEDRTSFKRLPFQMTPY